jgi:ferredoxin--NADP+ reductase
MKQTDLVILGDSAAAASLETEAGQAGLTNVMRLGATPAEIDPDAEGGPIVTVSGEDIQARAVAVVEHQSQAIALPVGVPETLAGRVHRGELPPELWDSDVLVVGGSEAAAELADRLARERTGVVLARGNTDPAALSRVTLGALLRREAERRLTVLWQSRPVSIEDIGGEPMVAFDSPGTPDLVFDHVVFVDDGTAVTEDDQKGPVWQVGDGGLPAGRAWETIRRATFPEIAEQFDRVPSGTEAEDLRSRHYNAAITYFERSHSDLWLIRVRPDRGDVSHEAGQYASLGLGYWEPRSDGARDPGLERKWENMVRRSYSISSPVFDDAGYLADASRSDTLEFYIVLVPATPDRVPGFTPRLALKRPGDRIYVGPRVVGRYTLTAVTNPTDTVVFLSTGTGEAPHNAMIVELLRKGHEGPIVSVVSVRYRADLAYLDTHRRLEERFPNYNYLPLVTRDPEVEKLYVQDVVERALLEEWLGVALDPATTHVYLCGNPAMIGLPQWEGDQPRFPDTPGTCELLAGLGFDLDRHGHVGNVHTEKYW